MENLIHNQELFVFLHPPHETHETVKATTNILKGGINKQLKDLDGSHRGMFDKHQRITIDWWLYTHTENPLPPLALAKQQDFGKIGKAAAHKAWTKEQHERQGHPSGRPATYDTRNETE